MKNGGWKKKTKTAAERHYTMVGLNLQPPTGQIQKFAPLPLRKPSYVGQLVMCNKPEKSNDLCCAEKTEKMLRY
jgi:hypothetical protein